MDAAEKYYCMKCKLMHLSGTECPLSVEVVVAPNGPFTMSIPNEQLISAAADPGTPNTKGSNPKDVAAVFKLPMALVSPYMKMYNALSQYLGKLKYGAWNWRAGGAVASIYKSALERHMDCWWEGEELDEDGTPHLANALACLAILIEAKELKVLVDDRPPSSSVNLKCARVQLETLMKTIHQKYGDRKPKDWTIKDKVEFT